jgi:dihydrodipicolinate synthase/N-acetylneuraminate lyase
VCVKLFTGVVPALISPFNEGGGVNVDVVPKLVDFLIGSGCSGFYICGNTGEGFAMTKEERIEMAEATMKAVAGRVPVCVHVGACPLAEAQELCKHAKSIGAAAVSSVVPTDKPNDLAAAVEYFVGVGEAAEIPFYVYWVGQNIDSAVDATQFLEAMKVVPNFKVGIRPRDSPPYSTPIALPTIALLTITILPQSFPLPALSCPHQGLKFTDTNFYTFQQLHYQSKAIVGFKLNCVTGPDEMALAGLIMGSDGAIGSTYNIQVSAHDVHAVVSARDAHAGVSGARNVHTVLGAHNTHLLLYSMHCNSPTVWVLSPRHIV